MSTIPPPYPRRSYPAREDRFHSVSAQVFRATVDVTSDGGAVVDQHDVFFVVPAAG